MIGQLVAVFLLLLAPASGLALSKLIKEINRHVRLADIDYPDSMPEGASAKAYAIQWLQNSLVYLM
ncbi:MAG: hypothetical protein NTV15_00700 [Candidatus Bathyarchaeota archaeon]|nr:hypothetical protein [Candidatus Bathyarchaeota archaeon]